MKYTIMQIKDLNTCKYLFMPYAFAIKNDLLDLNDYEEVYRSSIHVDDGESLEHILDSIFTTFNVFRPEDFKGHSMSVSDLVKLEDGRVFYCDSCGWVEVTDDLL